MKKRVLALLATIGVLSLVGCETSSSMSGTYKVLGEEIKVTLDTSSGYSLGIQDDYFEVKYGGETVAGGIFVDEDTFNDYYSYISENLEYEQTKISDVTSLYYSTDNEYNHLVAIEGSNTYIIVSSLSEKDAKSVMDCLSFKEVD